MMDGKWLRRLGIITALVLASTSWAEQRLYVSARGDARMEIYAFDDTHGSLKLLKSVELRGGPGNSLISPDKKFLYVSVSSGKGKSPVHGIETLAVQADGDLKSVGFAETPYRCGFLSSDRQGQVLFASHYGEGRISSYQLVEGVYKGTVLQDLETDERAHSIRIDKSDSFVFVPHTAPNKVYGFAFTGGKLNPLTPAAVTGPDEEHRYHQPRHCVFHPWKNLYYTSNERGGGTSSWTYDQAGALMLQETHSTLASDAHEKFAASDITITPNGRFVYVANRDTMDRKAEKGRDSIAGFRLDPATGLIKDALDLVPIGRHPRCLLVDASGQFLFGAGVQSNDVTVYRIDPANGALQPLKTYATGTGPMWMQSLALPPQP